MPLLAARSSRLISRGLSARSRSIAGLKEAMKTFRTAASEVTKAPTRPTTKDFKTADLSDYCWGRAFILCWSCFANFVAAGSGELERDSECRVS